MVKKTFKNKNQDKAAIKQEVAMEARLKKIFNYYGFHDQKEKFKEEVLEFGAASQAYINNPSEEHLKELKEEICDLMVMDKQFLLTGNQIKLFDKLEGFYLTTVTHYEDVLKNIFRENRKEIESMMDRKIDRTLLRIASESK